MKHLNIFRGIFLSLLFFSTSVASAHDFEVDGIFYDITSSSSSNLEVCVTYKGSSYNEFSNEYLGSVAIPDSVAYNGGIYSVTGIKEYAFYKCSGLTGVAIGNRVTSIGKNAFYGCSGLANVTIGNSVTSIGELAFRSCSALTDVAIGNSVTSIENGVFYDCSGLRSVTIPSSVTSIGSSAFRGCSSLTDVTIPNSVISIGVMAFNKCIALTDITIPNSVTSIGDAAFNGCSGLRNVTIGNSVTSIETKVFYGCSSLTSIIIPNSVTSIVNKAFDGCTSLKELHIEDGETTLSLGYKSHSDENIGQGLFYDCPLESLYLGRNLSYEADHSYGYSPFYEKTALKSVTIGNSVTKIGEYAFGGCGDLTNVTIGNGVTSIGYNAFESCSSLTSVTIPGSVTSIGEYAFIGCSSLASMYLIGEIPPTLDRFNFTAGQYLNLQLYVPQGTLATYKATASWSEFENIQEFDVTGIDELKEAVPAFEYTAYGIALTNASGKNVAVYTASGSLVVDFKNYDGEDITLDKGIYIMVVNGKSAKAIVK